MSWIFSRPTSARSLLPVLIFGASGPQVSFPLLTDEDLKKLLDLAVGHSDVGHESVEPRHLEAAEQTLDLVLVNVRLDLLFEMASRQVTVELLLRGKFSFFLAKITVEAGTFLEV